MGRRLAGRCAARMSLETVLLGDNHHRENSMNEPESQEFEFQEEIETQEPVVRPFRIDPPPQEEQTPENLVEIPGEAEQAARSLEDAADSHQTLQGFYAMNNERPPEGVDVGEGNEKGDKE